MKNFRQSYNRLFLVGMMGSGKSSVGQELARRLDYHFFEMDSAIEQAESSSIADLFARSGEAHFRIVERDMLRTTINLHGVVIATGGGAPCFWDGMDFINAIGTSIYLRAQVATLLDRLTNAIRVRPLLSVAPEQALAKLWEERSSFYTRAHHTVDVDFLSKEQVVHAILERLATSPPVAG